MVFQIRAQFEALGEALLAGRFIDAWDVEDRSAVEAALQAMVDTYITSMGCDA